MADRSQKTVEWLKKMRTLATKCGLGCEGLGHSKCLKEQLSCAYATSSVSTRCGEFFLIPRGDWEAIEEFMTKLIVRPTFKDGHKARHAYDFAAKRWGGNYVIIPMWKYDVVE